MRLNIGARLLIIASLIVVAVFAAFTVYSDVRQRAAIARSLESKLQETATFATEGISNWMESRRLLIDFVGQTLGSGLADAEVHDVVSRPALAETFMFAYFGGADGAMIIHPEADLPSDYDPRARPWYADAAAAGSATLTEPYTDASTGDLIVTVTTPVRRDGALTGVVGGDINIAAISAIVRAIDLGGIADAFLVNDAGTVIIHPDEAMTLKPLSEAFPGDDPSTGRSLADQIRGDGDTLFAFFPIDGLPTVRWRLGVAIDRDAAFASLADFRRTALIATVIAILAIVGALWFTVRLRVSKPILAITDAMTRLADGDHDITVPGVGQRDEVGAMAAAVQVFRDNAVEMDRLAQENAKAAERVEAERRSALLGMADAFEQTVLSIVESVGTTAENTQSVAQELTRSAEDSNERTHSVSDAATATTDSVQSVASATEQLSASIREIGVQVTQSLKVAADAVEGVNRTNGTVTDLADAAQRIGEVVGLIQDVAGQTNLLALNATIEAARAGDVGKGFAVVASEVKVLAQQTDRATGEIRSQVDGIQDSSRRSVEDIRRISETIDRINEFTSAIASAIEQQSAATQEISASVQRAASSTKDVSANVSAVREASVMVTDEARRLLDASNTMRSQADTLRTEVQNFLRRVRAT